MSISQVVITKPGGLTSSESMASHLPMIIINPIPGQEEENAEFLENYGVARWLRDVNDSDAIISAVLNSNNTLSEMKEKTKLLAKPESTRNICRILLDD